MTIKYDMVTVNGSVLRKGTAVNILRFYHVNGGFELRIEVMDESGRVFTVKEGDSETT